MKKSLFKPRITIILLLSFFALFAGMGYMRYVEYRNIKKTSKTLDKLTGTFEQRQYLFARLVESFVTGRGDLETILYHPDGVEVEDARKKIVNDTAIIKQSLRAYKNEISDQTEQQLYDSLLTVYKKIIVDADHALGLMKRGQIALARQYDAQVIQPLYNRLQQLNFRLSDYVKERDFQKGDALISDLTHMIAFSKNMTYIIVGLLIILGILIMNAVQVIIRKRNLLAESEKKYRDFIEQTHELISRTDMRGKIIFINNKLKELLGYTDEELADLTVYDVVESDFLSNMREDFKHPEKIKSKTHVTGILLGKGGRKIHIEGDVIWEYKKNRFDGATAFINDVTEKHLLHNVLEESEKRFRRLFNMAPIPMFTVDPVTMKFLLVNKAALKFYGYTADEISKKTIMDIRPKDDIARTASAIALVIEENWNYNDYHTHLKKDGTRADVEVFSSRIEIGDRPFLLVSAVDITERKQTENKITQAIIKTQEQERYEIGSELHDNVCQILASAKMSMGLLKSSLPPEKEVIYKKSLESIELATDEIRNLSHRLAPVFFENGSLRDSLDRLISTFNLGNAYNVSYYFDDDLEEKNLSIELQLNLYRILQEQLRNIVKYSKATDVKLEVALDRESLRILITDNGVGFDPDLTTGGIGIANMKRRAGFFNGKVNINSAPGNGCEVLVTLPLEEDLQKEAVKEEHQNKKIQAPPTHFHKSS